MPEVWAATERLRLRRPTPADAGEIDDLDADPQVRRFVDAPAPRPGHGDRMISQWSTLQREHPRLGFWLAHCCGTGDFVGWFHLRPADGGHGPYRAGDLELGYRLCRRYWGRGLAVEGSQLLLAEALSVLDAPRVTASALLANEASIAVMHRLGMHHVDDWTYIDRSGTPQAAVVYGMTRAEYAALP